MMSNSKVSFTFSFFLFFYRQSPHFKEKWKKKKKKKDETSKGVNIREYSKKCPSLFYVLAIWAFSFFVAIYATQIFTNAKKCQNTLIYDILREDHLFL